MTPFANKIEIFCGTGGVGKTTLAAARAIQLASLGKGILLITIDPSKRLKQILNLTEEDSGFTHTVPLNKFSSFDDDRNHFDAILMSPEQTFHRLEIKEKDSPTNPILDVLMRPNGGMNEIMAIVEVQHQMSSNKYDTIILDTPPGKHFVDFLEAASKIEHFFSRSFVEVFTFFGKSLNSAKISSAPKKIVGFFLSSGLKKLFGYLEKVTGKDFVETFIDAIHLLYLNRDKFIEAIKFQSYLKKENSYCWYLVASTEQQKFNDTLHIKNNCTAIDPTKSLLIINKCLETHLNQWSPKSTQLEQLRIKNYYHNSEKNLKELSKNYFHEVLLFSESLNIDPIEHVNSLASQWSNHDQNQ